MKKVTAYPAVRTFLMVPPMFVLLSLFATRGTHRDSGEQRATDAAMFLRILASSQVLFQTSCGSGGYARALEQLLTPPPGSSDGFLDRSSIEKVDRSHTITLIPAERTGPLDCHGRPTAHSFSATAVPLVFLEGGRRSYTLAPDGTIWYSESAVPPSEPFARSGKRIN
jgi:hypothetical protein